MATASADEEQRMLEIMTGVTKPQRSARPKGGVYYCLRSEWRGTSDAKPKLKFVECCAPARWDHVRYFLERHLGMHSLTESSSAYIKAFAVTSFDDRALAKQTSLDDPAYEVDEDTVLILARAPLSRPMLRYVPPALASEFRAWFVEQEEKIAAAAKKRGGGGRNRGTRKRSDERSFCTDAGRFRHRGDLTPLPGGLPGLHASCYADKSVPPWFTCPRCGERGTHMESNCKRPHDAQQILPMARKRLVGGIPRSELIELDPASEEGRCAKLKDADGRVFKHRKQASPMSRPAVRHVKPEPARAAPRAAKLETPAQPPRAPPAGAPFTHPARAALMRRSQQPERREFYRSEAVRFLSSIKLS